MLYEGESYYIASLLLQEGIALTYLIAFAVILRQFIPLCGKNGVLPAKNYLESKNMLEATSIFQIHCSDRVLKFTAYVGIFVSVLAIIQIFSSFLQSYSIFIWSLLWILYISFLDVGQEFYNKGWDSILLESGFLAIFLAGAGYQASNLLIWLFRWVLFRLMFNSALVKFKGDECWKDLSCLKYHFETQPMPGPLSWKLHQTSDNIKKSGVFLTMALLTIVPIFYFFPQPYAAYAGIITIVYQLAIFSSGNYAWVNLITAVIAISTLPDSLFSSILNLSSISSSLPLYPYGNSLMAFSMIIIVLSIFPIKDFFMEFKYQNKSYGPFYLVNTYGTFSKVPKTRREIIVQGRKSSEDSWHDFLIKGQPDLEQRPEQISPLNQRLYYSFWILCQKDSIDQEWFRQFHRWLENDFSNIRPFLKQKSRSLDEIEEFRVVLFNYEFTSPEEKRENGKWWKRSMKRQLSFDTN